MTAPTTLGHARDLVELAQSYARLSETQRTVIVPGHGEIPTRQACRMAIDAARAMLARAEGEL